MCDKSCFVLREIFFCGRTASVVSNFVEGEKVLEIQGAARVVRQTLEVVVSWL